MYVVCSTRVGLLGTNETGHQFNLQVISDNTRRNIDNLQDIHDVYEEKKMNQTVFTTMKKLEKIALNMDNYYLC